MADSLTKIFMMLLLLVVLLTTFEVKAACVDNVVLVHGNAAGTSGWDNTYNRLLDSSYQPQQIFVPQWGTSNPALNNHSGSEETPVRQALQDALNSSCTGRIDVIAHSMGVTLAAQQIIKLGRAADVDTFVGIAGAYRGLRSCGFYPFNVPTPTCGRYGLSVSSPLLNSLQNKPIGSRVYSIKSYFDQVVCSLGTCLVYGVHSSRIPGEDASYTRNYGHFGLQSYTESLQINLIQ